VEPIGWATQIELIRHGAPHSGLRRDACSCRKEGGTSSNIYALSWMLSVAAVIVNSASSSSGKHAGSARLD
jgi:hypothetical protein